MPLEIALPEEQTLIKAARLYDGAAEQCDSHRYVTLSGDSITDMGASADLGTSAAEQFDQVIELNDEVTLMPGLINMHTHLTFSALPSVYDDALQDSDTTKTIRMIEALRAATDCGITTVRDCGTGRTSFCRLKMPSSPVCCRARSCRTPPKSSCVTL